MITLERLVIERERVRDSAASTLRLEISRMLVGLELDYPRHTFEYFEGQGAQFLTVTPSFLRLRSWSPGAASNYAVSNSVRSIYDAFVSKVEYMHDFCEEHCTDFNITLGEVSSDLARRWR